MRCKTASRARGSKDNREGVCVCVLVCVGTNVRKSRGPQRTSASVHELRASGTRTKKRKREREKNHKMLVKESKAGKERERESTKKKSEETKEKNECVSEHRQKEL